MICTTNRGWHIKFEECGRSRVSFGARVRNLQIIWSSIAMGIQQTKLRIENHTDVDIVSTEVSQVDHADFKGDANPKRNFQRVRIKAKDCIEKRLEVNQYSLKCPFTMRLTFANGTCDVFRINQKFCTHSCEPRFQHFRKAHRINFARARCQRDGLETLTIVINDLHTECPKEFLIKRNQKQYR